MGTSHTPEAEELAAQTPATRDRYVDLVRALSIGVVVFGHWLMAVVWWGSGGTGGANALTLIPVLVVLTWVLQIMPLFFFVGGFSNYGASERSRASGAGARAYLAGRVERLLRPTIPFAATWLVVGAVLQAIGGEVVRPALEVIARPVWFLAVYMMVVALAPVMVALHRRFGWGVPVTLVAGAVVVDILRIGAGEGWIGPLNFAFVWLLAHQLGFFYADGTFATWPRSRFAAMAGVGLTALVALTTSGPYPRSMVGLPGDRISNMHPPSICIVALTFWLIGLAMYFREPLRARLERPRTWRRVVMANGIIMTVFLWHITALLIGVAILLPLGFPQPDVGTTAWWLTRLPWMAALTGILVVLVRVFARFEFASKSRPSSGGPPSIARAIGGAVALVAGLAIIALQGFGAQVDGAAAGWPVLPALALALLLTGRRLAGGSSPGRRSLRPEEVLHR